MLGLGSLLKKSTGMDYLNKDKEDAKEEKKSLKNDKKPSRPTSGLSKQDEKFLKTLEETLKKVNNQIEDMLEKIRVRRGL